MSFKENSYLQLWLPFHSAEGNHLCKLSKEQYEEHFSDFFSVWTSDAGGDIH